MNAQHSAVTDDHGSPPSFVELARKTLGHIDVDPASSPKWNANVGANRIITAEEDFRKTPWFPGAPSVRQLHSNPARPPAGYLPQTMFGNPPGDKRGRLVKQFWFGTAEYFRLGWCSGAVYVGFSVEQLARLQRVGAYSHPLVHVTLVPAYREDYLDGATGKQQEDATHASFVTLLSRSSRQIATFAALGAELGHVVNGDRR